jgi:hypothetical protein
MMVTTKNRGIFLRKKVGSGATFMNAIYAANFSVVPNRVAPILSACGEMRDMRTTRKTLSLKGMTREKESLLS